MGNYVDSSLTSTTTAKHRPSAYLPRTSVDRSHPGTPEQSRTTAIPTTDQQSSSNVTGAAHQQSPSLNQTVVQDTGPQGRTLHAQVIGSSRQHRTVQQPTSPSVVSSNAGRGPPSKRRRVTGTGSISRETSTLPPTPVNRGLIQGAENCLSGCIFIFSGHLPNLTKPQAQ
jgi:hypothetical protein